MCKMIIIYLAGYPAYDYVCFEKTETNGIFEVEKQKLKGDRKPLK